MCRLGCRMELLQSRARANVPTALEVKGGWGCGHRGRGCQWGAPHSPPAPPPRSQLTVPPPETGRSAGRSGGYRGPTPSSPSSAGFGCLIRLRVCVAGGRGGFRLNSPTLCHSAHPSPGTTEPPPTFGQPVWDFRLVLAANSDLALVSQEGFLDGVEHQRVEEAVLGGREGKVGGGSAGQGGRAPKSAPTSLGGAWGSPPSPGTGPGCRSR